jgi:hypothetical protein
MTAVVTSIGWTTATTPALAVGRNAESLRACVSAIVVSGGDSEVTDESADSLGANASATGQGPSGLRSRFRGRGLWRTRRFSRNQRGNWLQRRRVHDEGVAVGMGEGMGRDSAGLESSSVALFGRLGGIGSVERSDSRAGRFPHRFGDHGHLDRFRQRAARGECRLGHDKQNYAGVQQKRGGLPREQYFAIAEARRQRQFAENDDDPTSRFAFDRNNFVSTIDCSGSSAAMGSSATTCPPRRECAPM